MFIRFVVAAALVAASVAQGQGACMDQNCVYRRQCTLVNCGGCYTCQTNQGGSCHPQPETRCPTWCSSIACGPNTAKQELFDRQSPLFKEPASATLVRCVQNTSPESSFKPVAGQDLEMLLHEGEAGSPLLLIGVKHDAQKDFFLEGVVMNISTQTVTGYRIGWLMYGQETDDKVTERLGAKVRSIIPAGQKEIAPAQGVVPKEALWRFQRVVFYVAEVELADGTDWHADLSTIEAKYKLPAASTLKN